ncbi:alpha-mannosidase [Anabaena sp. PCC 7108]|uniref:alpha-mannosidase n=1 Tax=Anabaena sp. PCC 7108 TaxID=163908 RepID=UPI00034587A4
MTLSLSHTKYISDAIENLRACCQVNIQSSWLYQQVDWGITEVINSDLSLWEPVNLNDKLHIPWTAGKQVLWLVQKLVVPQDLQGYDLTGLCLRLALVWWADAAEIYVNGKLVLVGDLFDSSPRVLLSQAVSIGDEFVVALRLVSPGHCDGALMRSLLVFESLDYNRLDPGFLADELAVVQVFLERFVPEKLAGLVAGIEEVTNHRGTEDAEEEKEGKKEEWERFLFNIRESYLRSSAFICVSKSKIHLLGHAHLDLAWLWPVSETWKAAVSTFESVLGLQRDFPELVFCHTTPALYAWVEEYRPVLFAEIQNQVKAGKWEVLGGFWVEPDLNLISGESIVRQLLYGQRYFQERFGKISPVVWVPDTFGFCATLPQFFANAGIEFFVTQKLRWNDTTKFDYGAFWWRSLDGSQIFSFMSAPIGETIDPVKMANYACEWESNTGLVDSLWLPGVGDHGGGPTRDMLEIARRWEHSPIFPKLEFTTSEKYLQQIKSQSQNLPVWEDELYLEFHRGCYTTHADQKRWNRKSENLLYEAELFATLANVLFGVQYPQDEIEAAWKKVLFNQFHDILPGTSITQVYEDALPTWEHVEQVGNKILDESLSAIASHLTLPQPPQPHSIPIIIFNSLNWQRSQVVSVTLPKTILTASPSTQVDFVGVAPELYSAGNHNPIWTIYDIDGNQLLSQQSENSLLFLATVPSIGYQIYWLSPTSQNPHIDNSEFPQNWILENEYLRVQVNPETGDLESVFDKTQQREILNGAGNQLQAFEDSGQYWDAWNIDPDYNTKPLPATELKSIQWLEFGNIQQRLRVVRQLGNSQFCQDYILQTGSPLLKIANTVNWQENQVLVKTAFPLNVAADFATYEIPCGAIRRSTNPQTPAEKAKWEVPALRWADLTRDTETGKYGVSLVNDCKYGYDCQSNQIRLTLLRSPNWPDPKADRGIHEFTYALYPHSGSWETAHTVKCGYELNIPLKVLVNPPNQQSVLNSYQNQSFLNLSADNLIIMALKPSEDNQQKIIMRFYECHGKIANLSFKSDLFTLGEAVDLLERPINQKIDQIDPWKIATFKIIRNS